MTSEDSGPEFDGDGGLDDGEPNVAEEPEEEPGHPLTAHAAFPFLLKIIG